MNFKIKYIHLNASEIMVEGLLFLFLIISFLIDYIPAFKYLDEGIGVLLIILLIIRGYKCMQETYFRYIIQMIMMLTIAGIFYNLNSRLVISFSAVFIDAFGVFKNHLLFIAIVYVLSNINFDKIIRASVIWLKLYVFIVFLFGAINFFVDIGMSYNTYSLYRYGLRSYQFLFSNPSMVGITMLVCIAIFDYNHYSGVVKWFAFISMFLTLRATTLSSIAIYLILHIILSFNKKLKWYHIIIIILAAIFVGWGMISEYILSKSSNRYILIYYGIEVFKRYFPFGTGFATYGSQMAYANYSPLYTEFGFDKIWGLNAAYGGTVNDNFWPMVMAQLGLLGIVCMLGICFIEFNIVNKSTEDKHLKVGLLTLFFSLMISTIVSADLTGVAGMIRYFPLGMITAANYTKQKR